MQETNNHIAKWFNRKRILALMLFVSLVILSTAIYWFSYENKWLINDYDNQTSLTTQEDLFEDVFLYIQSAESGVRGYASTGNKKFIVNFNSAIDSIEFSYALLKDFQERESNKVRPEIFAAFDRLIVQKINFMQQIKQLCELNNCAAAMALIATEEGLHLTDSIINLNESTNKSLRNKLTQSKVTFSKINDRNNKIAYAGIIASMLFICLIFYFLFKEMAKSNAISRELFLSKEHFKVTLSSISEGLITTNKAGKVLFMNPTAEKLTGWSNKEAVDKELQQVYKVVNETTGIPFEHIVKRILRDGKTVNVENNSILHSKNSTLRYISNSGSAILDEKGNISGAVLVFNDITDKKRIEDKLIESEKGFRDLIETLPEAVYTCDEKGFIKLYNKAAVKLWGREPIIGKDLWCGSWKILNTDGSELPLEKCPMAIALKEERPVLGKEIIIQRLDGSRRHVLPSPSPIFNNAGIMTGVVNMLIDVTYRKEREILITKAEDKYKNLIEQASDVIVTYSFDGTIHEFNKILCTTSGYSREEFSKLNLNDIIVGDIISSQSNYFSLLAGNTVLLYRQFKRKDGVILDFELSARLLSDGNVLAIGRDITERKRNEEKIRKAIERYEILSNATSDTIWDWSIKKNAIVYNDGMKKMFGYELDQLENGVEWWKNNVHPDHILPVNEKLQKAFNNRSENIQMEYKYKCADGSYKNIYDRSIIVYDSYGKPIRMIGAMQDISAEKEQERRIAKAIVETQEMERRQMGMELHDNVNQLLSATLLYLGMAIKASKNGKEVSETLTNCTIYINDAINDIRNLSHKLAPYSKNDVSLIEVFQSLIIPMSKTGQFEINLNVDDLSESQVSNELQTNLYRILQEQLTNIVKYAKASMVDIHLNKFDQKIVLCISDNGIGFNPSAANDGIGLKNIKHRAEMFAGKCIINSSPGKGCILTVELPIDA